MKKTTYQIRAIRTKADYQAALQEVAPYFDNEGQALGSIGHCAFGAARYGAGYVWS